MEVSNSFEKKERPRIPEASAGVQVNYCKNPMCENFGIPALTEKTPKGRNAKNKEGYDHRYKVSGTTGKDTPALQCLKCGEYLPIKSNQGIAEERDRLLVYLEPPKPISCPNSECPNHHIPLKGNPSFYEPHGPTPSGYKRYRCKTCKKTFTPKTPTHGQKKPYKNVEIFSLLVNTMPLQRICKHTKISPPTLYGKIDFFYRQCCLFASNRERRMLKKFKVDTMCLATDRQEYQINWTAREDKRTTRLQSVSTADFESGYILCSHLNYDPDANPLLTELESHLCGDASLPKPFRRHARLWLPQDYNLEQKREVLEYKVPPEGLPLAIRQTYREALERNDIEACDLPEEESQLPKNGMQTRLEYTLYGHFLYLKEMLQGANRLIFYLDQESGIRAACFSAFGDKILSRRCDAFYVRINKDLTNDERELAVYKQRGSFRALKKQQPESDDHHLRRMLIKERMHKMEPIGKWKDKWLEHPFPYKGEPEKSVCHLTDVGDGLPPDIDQLYNRAGLYPVDTYFNKIRRMIRMAERSIPTASSQRRVWYGYSAYRADTLMKLLEIYRVYYNYCEPIKKIRHEKNDEGKIVKKAEKKTPAMRLGLAKKIMTISDILSYQP